MLLPDTPGLVQADHEESGKPAFAPPDATPPEVLFRHAGWAARRDKIREVMARVVTSPSRLTRWDNCGACACVEFSKVRQRHRVTCWHCRDRWCQPCQVARRMEVVKIIKTGAADATLRFITLTLRSDSSGLRVKLKSLKDAARRLFNSRWWKSHVTGGVVVLEVKKGKRSGEWHPHLHCVVEGGFIAVRDLSDAWKKASRGSFVVDIRAVKNADHAAGYVAKYMTKGVDASVMNDPDALAEAIVAMRGHRAYDALGSWRGRAKQVKATKGGDPDEFSGPDHLVNDWTTVATLREYLRGYAAQAAWAVAIHASLSSARYEKGVPKCPTRSP